MARKYSPAMIIPMTAKDIFASLPGIMRRMLGVLKNPRVQPVIWVAAVVIFFGGFAVSIAAQPSLIADIRIETMLVLVFILCPLMTAANMLRLERRRDLRERISPIPGRSSWR